MPKKWGKLFQIYVSKNSPRMRKNPSVHERRVCAQHHSCLLRNKASHDAQGWWSMLNA